MQISRIDVTVSSTKYGCKRCEANLQASQRRHGSVAHDKVCGIFCSISSDLLDTETKCLALAS